MTTMTPFDADMARFDKTFRDLDAIRTGHDSHGPFLYLDASRVPSGLLRAYRQLRLHGAANGWL